MRSRLNVEFKKHATIIMISIQIFSFYSHHVNADEKEHWQDLNFEIEF